MRADRDIVLEREREGSDRLTDGREAAGGELKEQHPSLI
jgi:hypothetical protein